MFDFDVCIIGTGRVGLPLGLAFVDAGLKAIGYDINADLRSQINQGTMPFREPGFDAIIAKKQFEVSDNIAVAARAKNIIITVGTPLHEHIESDLRQLQRVIEELTPVLRPGHFLGLRSTVAPRTTTFVKRFIEKKSSLRVGVDLGLAFCPERIAEGCAYEELKTLPQVVGCEDTLSKEASSQLFETISPKVLHTSFLNAELVKLFTNAERYVHFALANQFALVADTLDGNIYEIQSLANYEYPRNQLASPGLTAGACLRKDFGMINEWNPYPDILLSAWKMNESIPLFLVDHLRRRTTLIDQRVAILGYTFKQDSDDIRDSLVPKLYRYLQRECPHSIKVSDHNLTAEILDPVNGTLTNTSWEEATEDADVVFVATNHNGYDEVLKTLSTTRPDCWIVDIWNVGGTGQIFYQAQAIADLGSDG
ncbi:MAG: nucleotide sugar dehydrogenase [Myxococcales bacterium]|nr:nucleotide sugar dehydrogenase [Myxococcales bacterium]